MKKYLIVAMATILLSSPLSPVLPARAGHDMSGMDMKGDAKSTMLESIQQDGVTAMPHLMDVREAMAKHGMKETHHLMVMFSDTKTGKPLTDGAAAVKVIDPAGVKSEPIKMMLMGDGFGADIALTMPGKYGLEVGSKLADGKRRVFTFNCGN